MTRVAEVRYRRATSEDFPAEHAVFCRAQGDLFAARGFEWQDPPLELFEPGLRHLLDHDAPRCWVAEVDDRVVGFTAAIVRDATWFLSRLFIDPKAQGRGIGRRLLEHAIEGAPARRLTITDSIQPVSNALYGRFGLLPITPVMRLVGMVESGTSAAALERGDADAGQLQAVDRAAYGFDRTVDHGFWATQWARRAWFRGGELVAWIYRRPDRTIGPLAALDPATAAAAFDAELAEGGPTSVVLPASSRTLLRAALDAGLRIDLPMGLLLASDGVRPPDSLAISTYGFL